MLIYDDDEIARHTNIVDGDNNVYDCVKNFDTETKIGEVYVILRGKNNRIARNEDGETPAVHKIKFPASTIAINKETGEEIK